MKLRLSIWTTMFHYVSCLTFGVIWIVVLCIEFDYKASTEFLSKSNNPSIPAHTSPKTTDSGSTVPAPLSSRPPRTFCERRC